MNLSYKNLKSTFFISLIFFLILPFYYPALRLFNFVPFLIIMIYQKPLIICLWGALSCGLFVDLFASEPYFAMHGLNYAIMVALFYQLKTYFFADSLSTLPLMTFLFSAFSTLLHLTLYYAFGISFSLSWEWVQTDLLLMPFLDSIYAFTVFIMPFFLFGKKQRKAKDYFMERGAS